MIKDILRQFEWTGIKISFSERDDRFAHTVKIQYNSKEVSFFIDDILLEYKPIMWRKRYWKRYIKVPKDELCISEASSQMREANELIFLNLLRIL